jgi:hypothetical protein
VLSDPDVLTKIIFSAKKGPAFFQISLQHIQGKLFDKVYPE